jgi:hypothetical protein
MRRGPRNFGFPFLVLVALVGSGCVAMSSRVPTSVPDYALQSSVVYRLEVGAACFVVVYLAAIAFFLALDGRGFVELGTRGLKAERVIRATDDEQDVALAKQIEANRSLDERLKVVEAGLDKTIRDLQTIS